MEALSGIPGSVGATPDPERRGVRRRGRPARHHRADAGPQHRQGPDAVRGRVRVRLPDLGLQEAARAATSSSTSRSSSGSARCPRPSATPSSPGPSASRWAPGSRPRRSARRCWRCAAPRAWCSTTPTPTPGAPGRSSPTRCCPPTPRPRCPRRPRATRSRTGGSRRARPGSSSTPASAAAGATGPARVSTKHSLALTNRGSARAADVLALARTVRAGVEQAFGVTLEPEPVLVGCSLDERRRAARLLILVADPAQDPRRIRGRSPVPFAAQTPPPDHDLPLRPGATTP